MDTFVYTSAGLLLVHRRGFRGWSVHVGVWPLPRLTPTDFDDYLQGCLRELPMKRIKPKEDGKAAVGASDPVWKKHYPSFVAFLTDGEYDAADGGGKRELGLVTLWASGGVWSAKLRDNDSGHVCYVTGATLDELFKTADAACSDPAGGWKPDAGGSGKRRR